MNFITRYKFKKDHSRPGRILSSVKVGEVYISKLDIEPGIITGNYYNKKANRIMFVEEGQVMAKFVSIESGKSQEFKLTPDDGIVHVPALVAVATKNTSDKRAALVFFSDAPLRSEDNVVFEVYKVRL